VGVLEDRPITAIVHRDPAHRDAHVVLRAHAIDTLVDRGSTTLTPMRRRPRDCRRKRGNAKEPL
jgi:hypothetical protein